jgi:hypothetical protein
MAFIQSSTKDLSLGEYVLRLGEAYELRMRPYDFRVWDRYLFSRCSEKVPVLGLFQLFEWPMIYLPGTSEECFEKVGQWCIQGTFIDGVKSIIVRLRDRHFDRERADLDLAFIEKHQAIFKDGPMQLSAVGKKEQDVWCDQAKRVFYPKIRALPPQLRSILQNGLQGKRHTLHLACSRGIFDRILDGQMKTPVLMFGINWDLALLLGNRRQMSYMHNTRNVSPSEGSHSTSFYTIGLLADLQKSLNRFGIRTIYILE